MPLVDLQRPVWPCYDPDTFSLLSHLTHYITRAGTLMTHSDSH